MDFIPLQDTLLCEKTIPEKVEVVENGITFQKEQFPQYKILKIGEQVKNVDLKVGDIISTDSIPTCLDKDKNLYLITEKYVMAISE